MERILVSCLHCREVKSVKGIYTHVDRAHLKLTKYSSGNNGSYDLIKQRVDVKNAKLEDEYFINPSHCNQCSKILPYDKREQTFCSYSCSAIYTNARKDYSIVKTGPKKGPPTLYTCICVNCKVEFKTIKRAQQSCTRACGAIHKNAKARANRSAFTNYRADCEFKFSLNDYPEEFDFTLVKTHGWYKAKNRGDNLGGVSRDHMISVRWGFDNGIPAKHISHPANCRLITQSENARKNKQNFITYEELLDRIRQWDKKYPPPKVITLAI